MDNLHITSACFWPVLGQPTLSADVIIFQYPPSTWFFSLINKVPYILLISNLEFSFGHKFGFWSIWPERIRLKINRKPDQRHIYYSIKGPTNLSFFLNSYLWKDPNQIVFNSNYTNFEILEISSNQKANAV